MFLVGNRRRLLQRHGKQFLWGGESRRTARRAISRPRPRIRRGFDISCGSFASLSGVTSACLAAESAWGQSSVITCVNEELNSTTEQQERNDLDNLTLVYVYLFDFSSLHMLRCLCSPLLLSLRYNSVGHLNVQLGIQGKRSRGSGVVGRVTHRTSP